MRENVDQNNPEYGHFSLSVSMYPINVFKWLFNDFFSFFMCFFPDNVIDFFICCGYWISLSKAFYCILPLLSLGCFNDTHIEEPMYFNWIQYKNSLNLRLVASDVFHMFTQSINDAHMEELVLYWFSTKIHWNTRLASSDIFHMFT